METEDGLENLIKEYEAQLVQVEMTMGISEDVVQEDLKLLCTDLKQLIDLTKDSLLSLKKKRLLQEIESMQKEVNETTDSSIHNAASTSQGEQATDETGSSDTDMKRLLESLEGTKCQAPFGHEWGQVGYYNALVLSAEPNHDISDASDIKVRVLFCNPTSNAMKPCPYFMEGECRFDDAECRFSHGHVVAFQTLKQFSDPNYSLLQRDALCLAKFTDGLWYPAVVESVDDVDHKITVKYTQYGTIATLELEDIIPKEHDAESESDDNESDDDQPPRNSGSDEEADLLIPTTAWISTVPTSQALGQWEKHTRGIGSKLMEKMGYVLGMGLGKNGEGRTEPVEAVVLPQGKSLDRVMELKEKAGNRDLLKVEKKLRRKQQRKEKVVQDGYDFVKKASVFDFINSKLASSCSNETVLSNAAKSPKVSANEQVLKSASIKHLNTQSFQVSEDIRKAQLELERLRMALTRNETRDRIISSQLKEKINLLENNLQQLKAREKAIHGEQHLRKSDKKLAIF